MEKEKFMQMQELYEQYQSTKLGLEKLLQSKEHLAVGEDILSLFPFQIGNFKWGTESEMARAFTAKEMKPLVEHVLDYLTDCYEKKIRELDATIEKL